MYNINILKKVGVTIMFKRVISAVLATLFILSSMASPIMAYDLPENDGKTEFDPNNTAKPYADSSIFTNTMNTGKLGLPEINSHNMADMKEVAGIKSSAPSLEEIAANSGDIINVEAQKALYGMGKVVDHITTKQMTVDDMETFMWSFIISQFATPYSDNMLDVLEHPVFREMIQQDLEIASTPSAGAGALSWQEVWKPNTQVADKVKFKTISDNVRRNLQYRILYKSDGKSRASLYDYLTADVGALFYIIDREADFGKETQQELWDKRADLITNYKSDDIQIRDKLVPIYVQSNAGIIQNQVNLGGFLKGQTSIGSIATVGNSGVDNTTSEPTQENEGGVSSDSGYVNEGLDIGTSTPETSSSSEGTSSTEGFDSYVNSTRKTAIDPTFANIIGTVGDNSQPGGGGASGVMGAAGMYVDSFGNICAYHDNKMKIVLSNAQNTIFTSRPDDDDKINEGTLTTVNGEEMTIVPGGETGSDSASAKVRVSKFPMAATSKYAGDMPEGLYSGLDVGERVEAIKTVMSNESLNIYNKAFITSYSRTTAVGDWDGDTGIYTTRDAIMLDFPGFLHFRREYQNSHRNQVVIFKPPTFDTLYKEKEGNFGKNKKIPDPDPKTAVKVGDANDAGNSIKNTLSIYAGLSTIDSLRCEDEGNGHSYLIPGTDVCAFCHLVEFADANWLDWSKESSARGSQSYYKLTTEKNFGYSPISVLGAPEDTKTEHDEGSAIRNTANLLLLNGVSKYMERSTKGTYPWMAAFTKGPVAKTTGDKPTNVLMTNLIADTLNNYNQMLMFGMGYDQSKLVPNSLLSHQFDSQGEKNTFSVGGALIDTVDYGQYWPLVNKVLKPDASLSDILESGISFKRMQSDSSKLYPGLLQPQYKRSWTLSLSEKENLEAILSSIFSNREDHRKYIDSMPHDSAEVMKFLGENEGHSRGSCTAGLVHCPLGTDQTDESISYKNFINNHADDVFSDNTYFLLKDTRVSDAWVTYDAGEVSLIAYTWLNYYLPKSLIPRTFIDGTYEDSTAFKTFVEGYNKGLVDDSKNSVNNGEKPAEKDDTTNAEIKDELTSTARIDGVNNGSWRDTQQILGPYQSLHGPEMEEKCKYRLYPDTAPYPAVIDQKFLTATYAETRDPSKGIESKVRNYIEINPYDLIMALYRNTNDDANEFTLKKGGASVPVVDKNDILQGLSMFVNHPAETLVAWVSSFMQAIHRSLAAGAFGDFFRLSWITDTGVWNTISAYYFVIVLSLVFIASIYLFFQMLVNEKAGIWKACKQFAISVVAVIIPIALMNGMVIGLDAAGKGLLTSTSDKSSVMEVSAQIKELVNASADFEYNYQLFREQFDSVEAITANYTYSVPTSYYKSLDKFKYKQIVLKNSINNVRWTSNQTATKWYDYRAFVPVNKARYSQDLYYYFYDYIKWQYLQYLATSPVDSGNKTSIRLQDRAQEYTFGTNTKFDGSEEGMRAIQQQCLSFGGSYDWIADKTIAKFIDETEKLMLKSVGNYAVMMDDPNYTYGQSFLEDGNKRYGGYFYEDLFGLGYLMTDQIPEAEELEAEKAKAGLSKWEPSTELYRYPGWQRFKEDDHIKPLPNYQSAAGFFQNQKEFLDAHDLDLPPEMLLAKESHNGTLYGSQIGLSNALGFFAPNDGKLRRTNLEDDLFNLNERIYNRVHELIRFFPSSAPDEAYISLAALTASFEFSKEFGGGGILSPAVEPQNFDVNTISMDSVLKGIFAQDITDLTQSRELMYMIIDHGGGFAIIPCLFLVLGDLFAFMTLISRNLLMSAIFAFSVILCIIHYMLKRDQRNKALLGIGFQVVGLFASHIVVTLGLNMLTYFSATGAGMMKDVLIAILFAFILFVSALIHGTMLFMVVKDFGAFGGNIVAKKLEGIKAKFGGVFNGRDKYRDLRFRKMHKDADNKLEQGISNQANTLNRLNTRMQALQRGSQDGQDAEESKSIQEQMQAEQNYQNAVMRMQYASSNLARAATTYGSGGNHSSNEMGMPNVGVTAGVNGISGISAGGDSRFNRGATLSNSGIAKLDKKRSISAAIESHQAGGGAGGSGGYSGVGGSGSSGSGGSVSSAVGGDVKSRQETASQGGNLAKKVALTNLGEKRPMFNGLKVSAQENNPMKTTFRAIALNKELESKNTKESGDKPAIKKYGKVEKQPEVQKSQGSMMDAVNSFNSWKNVKNEEQQSSENDSRGGGNGGGGIGSGSNSVNSNQSTMKADVARMQGAKGMEQLRNQMNAPQMTPQAVKQQQIQPQQASQPAQRVSQPVQRTPNSVQGQNSQQDASTLKVSPIVAARKEERKRAMLEETKPLIANNQDLKPMTSADEKRAALRSKVNAAVNGTSPAQQERMKQLRKTRDL